MTSKHSCIIMVGIFPPPIHGMAEVNAAVREQLQTAGAVPLVIVNLATPSLDRSLMARLSRVPKVIRGLVRLAGMRRFHSGTLYMSMSGGLGQAYELAFLVFARLCRMRVFLHHHSFAYLDRPNRITALIAKLAGRNAMHIVLSPGMSSRLKKVYGVVRVVPVSNTVFLFSHAATSEAPVRRQLETLGFLSNIAPEKGVFEFLDLLSIARDKGLLLRAKIAGPFQDHETERQVKERLATLPEVEYVGPKYGKEKDAFYATVDALVFPTLYLNEAEPLTLLEAMRSGLPVIAYGRGAIPEIVGTDFGKVVDPADPFVPAALTQINVWLFDPSAFEAASRAAVQRFSETYVLNEQRWFNLLTELVGSTVVSAGESSLRI